MTISSSVAVIARAKYIFHFPAGAEAGAAGAEAVVIKPSILSYQS